MKFLLETEIEKWGKNVMIHNVVEVLGRYKTRELWRTGGTVEEVDFFDGTAENDLDKLMNSLPVCCLVKY